MISSLYAGFLAVALGAAHVAAQQCLSVSVTGPPSVVDVENLKLVTTITNSGNESVKILNSPSSPLSTFSTDTFTITHASGAPAQFIGVRAKYSPATAARTGDYNVLAPGHNITIERDLSDAYNLTNTGAGDYIFEANNLFYVVDDDNNVSTIRADSQAHTAKVTGRLAVSRRDGGLAKRASFHGCDASQQTVIKVAATRANAYVFEASTYLKSIFFPTPRYTLWFGKFDDGRHNTVLSHFRSLSTNDFSTFTYFCNCNDTSSFAFATKTFGEIHVCPLFWQAPLAGTDSQAGTIVDLSSSFARNGGAGGFAFGQDDCQALARDHPDSAVNNQESIEYFAENDPFQQ